MLTVVDQSGEVVRIGVLRVRGMVENTGELEVRLVQLRVTVYDEGGAQVSTQVGYIDSDVLLPGHTSTFTILVDVPQDRATRFTVEVEDAQCSSGE